jgi:signal peptidase I
MTDPEQPEPQEPETTPMVGSSKRKKWLIVVGLVLAGLVVLLVLVRVFIAKPYEIPTDAMEPTIQPNDQVLVNRVIYDFRSIARGDIILFSPPRSAIETCAPEPHVPFVKRVIGLPGDVVTIEGGVTRVNGTVYRVRGETRPDYSMSFPPVPKGDLLVLGDNRPNSCDSHQWVSDPPNPAVDPFVPQKDVAGEVQFIYWPVSRMGFVN